MKKLFIILLTSYFLLLYSSCKKTFDINAGYQDIPVIYGILNQTDTIHYIRVNKAFLGIGNALVMAKNFDSTNYPKGELLVQLQEFVNYQSNPYNPKATYTLSWDTVRKSPGVFYDPSVPEQTVFTTNAKLNANYTYQLVVTNLKTHKVFSAITNLIYPQYPPLITNPQPGEPYYFIGTQEVQWNSAVNGVAYQLIIRFHYTETNLSTNQQTSKYIDWEFPIQIATSTQGGLPMLYNFNAAEFYLEVSSQLLPNPALQRTAGLVDFMILVANNDLNTYLTVNAPSTTLVQEKPDFTNISNGGIGIFASRYVNTLSLQLSVRSLDSLVYGVYTKNLGFIIPNP